MKTHEEYMHIALNLAKEAYNDFETPVGCVIVDSRGNIVGRGRNRSEKEKSITAHAEMEAIRAAGETIGDWRLDGCSLYVTLEPCPMCAGAIIMSRLSKVYYGAKDELTGTCGSIINIFMEPYACKTAVYGGILADESETLLKVFFKQLR